LCIPMGRTHFIRCLISKNIETIIKANDILFIAAAGNEAEVHWQDKLDIRDYTFYGLDLKSGVNFWPRLRVVIGFHGCGLPVGT